MPRVRSTILFLILSLGILNGAKALTWEWRRRNDPDLVGAAEQRHTPLRLDPAFPRSVSFAGGRDAFYPGDDAGFRLLQYSLAPILVSDRVDQEWLVWNGTVPVSGAEVLRGYTLNRQLGPGLYLYRRSQR